MPNAFVGDKASSTVTTPDTPITKRVTCLEAVFRRSSALSVIAYYITLRPLFGDGGFASTRILHICTALSHERAMDTRKVVAEPRSLCRLHHTCIRLSSYAVQAIARSGRSQNLYRMLGDFARFSTSPQATRPYLARATCAVCSRVRYVRPVIFKSSSGRLCANFGSAQSSCESHYLCLFPSRNNDRLVGFIGMVWSRAFNQTRPGQQAH
jgi:hypothetical protein